MSAIESGFIDAARAQRKALGWTMERLVDEIVTASGGEVVMHQTAITKLEREADRRRLRLEEAYWIARVLDIPLPAAPSAPCSTCARTRADLLHVAAQIGGAS